MVESVTRKRIEILADTPLVPRLINHAREAGVAGWTVLHVDSGGGRDGPWQNDDITGAAAKTIILMITSESSAKKLMDTLAPLLDSYGLLLTIGDVQVVRGERF